MADVSINSNEMTVEIEGLKFVETKLHSLDAKVRGTLKANFRNVGFVVQREARRNAPYKEGNLERSITFEAGEDYVKIFVPINSPAGQYALLRHDGVYNYGPGTLAKGPQAGRKYLTRAVDDNREKIRSILKPGLTNL